MGAFKESCCVPTKNVACMLNKKREEQVAGNVSVIKSLMECVCMCGKQWLLGGTGMIIQPLRSMITRAISLSWFSSVLRLMEVLRAHLAAAPRNAVYTSKTIQNEMISVIGSHIQKAKYFSLLADEVVDCANLEQVSIVLRFVDRLERNFLVSLLWNALLEKHFLKPFFPGLRSMM